MFVTKLFTFFQFTPQMAAFMLKLQPDWTKNHAITDDVARKIKINFLIHILILVTRT